MPKFSPDYSKPANRPGRTKEPRVEVRVDDAGAKDKYGRTRRKAMSTVSLGYMMRLKRILLAAGDPAKQDGPVKTLADMSPQERAAIEARYGAKING